MHANSAGGESESKGKGKGEGEGKGESEGEGVLIVKYDDGDEEKVALGKDQVRY
eukprot:g6279.t1